MPDHRTHQSIAQRVDVDFQRRPDRLLRRRRTFLAAAGLISFAPLVYAILSGDETIYWSRPCSESHGAIEHNCQLCHIERFQGLMMQVEDPDYARSIEARTCRTCHEGREAADHSAQMVAADIVSCFECHREHRGQASLTRVPDGYCTACHADLQTADGELSFAKAIDSLNAHPEFALRRRAGDDALRPGPRHTAPALASLSEADGEWDWSDRTQLRFNHRLHLDADGIAAPTRDGSARLLVLECGDCHQPDAAGRYMRPINYEQHCQSCHPLHYGEELFRFDAQLDLGGPLPHESPRIVRDALRNRLLAWANAHPDQITGREATEPPRLPHKPPPAGLAARDKWEWVDQRIADIESIVYGKSSDVRFPRFMQGCTYCHVVEPDTSGAADGAGVPLEWTIAPPNIPDRWLPHSRFRHDRHDNLQLRGKRLECVDCHYRTPAAGWSAADGRNAASHDGPRRPGSIFESSATQDVLLPSIDTCRECHGRAESRAVISTARDDCVECHGYHHRPPAAE